MTRDEMMLWIDNATYEQLLSKWRHAPVGDPFFVGEVGVYYSATMSRRRDALLADEHVRASKAVGWEKP